MTSLADLDQEVRLLRGQLRDVSDVTVTVISDGGSGPPPALTTSWIGVLADLPTLGTADPAHAHFFVDNFATLIGEEVLFAEVNMSSSGTAWDWSYIEHPYKNGVFGTVTGPQTSPYAESNEFLAAWAAGKAAGITPHFPRPMLPRAAGSAHIGNRIAHCNLSSGSATVTAASGTPFVAGSYTTGGDVGRPLHGPGIPADSYIGVVHSATSIGLSSAQGSNVPVSATSGKTNATVTIDGDAGLGSLGFFDEHWTALAQNLLAAGLGDAILRVSAEFNLAFNDVSTALEFVGYWKRIVNAMRAVSPDFRFFWCPARGGSSPTKTTIFNTGNVNNFGPWYPDGKDALGKPYVDIIGLDFYNQYEYVGQDWLGGNSWIGAHGGSTFTHGKAHTGALYELYGLDWLARFVAQKQADNPDVKIAFGEWGISALNASGQGDSLGVTFIQNFSQYVADNQVYFACYFEDGSDSISLDKNPLSLAEARNDFGPYETSNQPPKPTPLPTNILLGSEANAVSIPTSLDGGYDVFGGGFEPPIFSLRRDNNDGIAAGDNLGRFTFGGFYGARGDLLHDGAASIIGYARGDWDDTNAGSGFRFEATAAADVTPQLVGQWTTQGMQLNTTYRQVSDPVSQLGTSLNLQVNAVNEQPGFTSTSVPYSLLGKYPRSRVNLEGKVDFRENSGLYGQPPAFQHAITYANFAQAKIPGDQDSAGMTSLSVDDSAGFPASGTLWINDATSFTQFKLTYTSILDDTFNGVTVVSGSGTIHEGSFVRSAATDSTVIAGQGFLNVPIIYGGNSTQFPNSGDGIGGDSGIGNHNWPGFFNAWEIGFYDGPVFAPWTTDDLTNSGLIDAMQQVSFVSYSFPRPGTRMRRRYGFYHDDLGDGFLFHRTTANGNQNVGALGGTLNVASTTGFSVGLLGFGQLTVPTNNGIALLTFTGKTATSFTGVALAAGSGTVADGAPVTDGALIDTQVGVLIGNLGSDGATLGPLTSATTNYGVKMAIGSSAGPAQYGIWIDQIGTPGTTQVGIWNNAQLVQVGDALFGQDVAFGTGIGTPPTVDFTNATVVGISQDALIINPIAPATLPPRNISNYVVQLEGVAVPSTFRLQRSDGIGTTPPAFQEILGILEFGGYDGSSRADPFGLGAAIWATTTENFSAGSTNHWGTELQLGITPDGTNSFFPHIGITLGTGGDGDVMVTFPANVTFGTGSGTPPIVDFTAAEVLGLPTLGLQIAPTPPATVAPRNQSNYVVQLEGISASATFALQRSEFAGFGSANNGTILGTLEFRGEDGSSRSDPFGLGAAIWATATQDYSAGTPNHWGTKLQFGTMPNSTTQIFPSVALTIDQDQSATFAGLATFNAGVVVGSGVLALSGGLQSSNSTGGIGYTTGAGNVATQATSKSTGVTMNRVCGRITMNSAALANGASVTFTLTNSQIAASDVLIINVTGNATAGAYLVGIDNVQAGSCRIHLRNVSAASKSEAVILQFAVFKSSTN